MPRILIIEDDAVTGEAIRAHLGGCGHEVAHIAEGVAGLAAARRAGWDAIVLDRMLPGLDGLAILEGLRQNGIRMPSLILSALSDVDERIRGLQAGGDDYLTKPFSLGELGARIEALLRRPALAPETVLRLGPLELDLLDKAARRGARPLDLLPREFKLLVYLVRRAGQVVTPAMLFRDVWNYNFMPRSNVLHVHMGRLRRKLDARDEAPMIANVRGTGYMIDAPF